VVTALSSIMFPIPRDPPEGGTEDYLDMCALSEWFPIPRDPPEGGTGYVYTFSRKLSEMFPIPRDPPEGGTICLR